MPSGEIRSSPNGPCGAAIEPGVAGRTAYTLRVQTGCAEPCSYCIIPSTRGQPRSVPVDALLSEVVGDPSMPAPAHLGVRHHLGQARIGVVLLRRAVFQAGLLDEERLEVAIGRAVEQRALRRLAVAPCPARLG